MIQVISKQHKQHNTITPCFVRVTQSSDGLQCLFYTLQIILFV